MDKKHIGSTFESFMEEIKETGLLSGDRPRPDIVLIPTKNFRLLDRHAVRYGWMPVTREGKRYARRLRRMARKRKRGWA